MLIDIVFVVTGVVSEVVGEVVGYSLVLVGTKKTISCINNKINSL